MAQIDTLDRLEEADEQEDIRHPFGPYEEEAIISLSLDHPQFFSAVCNFMQPAMFRRMEAQWVMAEILNAFEEFNAIPTREILYDRISGKITEDDPFEEVLGLVRRKSNPREIPMVKDTLLKWARDRQYGLLYSDEAIEAYRTGNYAYLEDLVAQANRIADVSESGFWFFENLELLFQPDIIDHRTTGFPKLDKLLNNGGPSKKEVVCWLAGTNVGKSILLCNNAISSLQGESSGGEVGQNVLLITFELDSIKTAMRCLGAATGVPLNHIVEKQDYIRRMVRQMERTYKKKFAIYEWAPDECSVSHIYALLDNLKRTKGWKPDVIILDYMDLMISRVADYNKTDYDRQKHVANEIRGLAKNEDVLVYTATQTNRSGAMGEELADLNKAAESFAKQFSLDYIVSLNQSDSDRKATPHPRIRFFIAKNRNGPKHEQVECEIEYDKMQVREVI
jgi:replicative DNA helicase